MIRTRMHKYLRQCLAFFVLSLLWQIPSYAQEDAHDIVRRSLVHLDLSGTPQSGPNISVPGGAKSQGTGFFVSSDGLILTTLHLFDPLKKVNAVNQIISARIGDSQASSLKVQFVSDLPSLDLVLLKADIPAGTPAPPALDIGSSTLIANRNRHNGGDADSVDSDRKLFTSGFQGNDYQRSNVQVNERKSSDVAFAWTINVKTDSGQSGSPVYIKSESGVEVVGIVKATSREDDELTLMVPIEFSMPLVGHLKFQELSEKVDFLMRVVGNMPDTDTEPVVPLNSRVQNIEGHVKEIEAHFTWHAESRPNGSVLISYEKIISGGPQVDYILVNMTPFMRFYDDSEARSIYTGPAPELRMPNSGKFERLIPDSGTGKGEFVIPGVARSLKSLADLTARAVGLPEPYRDLEIALIPVVADQRLSKRKLKVVPDYDWDSIGSNPTLASN